MLLTINKITDGQWLTGEGPVEGSIHNAKLVGTLDEHTVSQLQGLSDIVFDEKAYSEGDHFLIDLSGVTEIDHVGLATLVGIIVVLAVNAGSLGLIIPKDHPVRHSLKVSGLDRVFEVYETPEAADAIVLALRRSEMPDG